MTDIIGRIKEGTKIRLRPVLMTATVASLGFCLWLFLKVPELKCSALWQPL